METRTLLQIVLGTIAAAIVVIGVALVYELTRSPSTQIIEKRFEQEKKEKKEEKNPWEDREQEAIELVKNKEVGELEDETLEMIGVEEEDDEERTVTIAQVIKNDTFVAEKLHLGGPKRKGWEAEWWGETKYGPYFYLVQYGFEDANVTIGPTWLVQLEDEKVVPKNISAQVATNPKEAVESEYYGKSERVVTAMVQHTFESGVNLGGTLLTYFDERTDMKEDDEVLGWTIQHEREEIYTAYFQWVESGEPTYARFEFDYERKALKAANLHAGNIMRAGESFEEKEPVSVLPTQFDSDADSPSEQWTGAAGEQYRNATGEKRDTFEALGTVLNERNLITALEWLLRVRAKTPEEFEKCKKKRNCSWKTDRKEEGIYSVTYAYDLGEGEQEIEWKVELKDDEENQIQPVGRLSKLAYRAVNPRHH